MTPEEIQALIDAAVNSAIAGLLPRIEALEVRPVPDFTTDFADITARLTTLESNYQPLNDAIVTIKAAVEADAGLPDEIERVRQSIAVIEATLASSVDIPNLLSDNDVTNLKWLAIVLPKFFGSDYPA